jgi:hypothetical protein
MFERIIPENGYRYYVAKTHLGSDLQAQQLLERPDVYKFITEICDKLGK